MSLISAVLDLVYPRACTVCGGNVGDGAVHICWDCATRFTVIQEPYCSLCGDPVDGRVENVFRCSFCRRDPPHYDLARSALRFRDSLRDVLHAFKYRHACRLSKDLVRWLLACHHTHYAEREVDMVACVPLYPRRRRHRTYNQAELLARELARSLRLPLFSRALVRVRPTDTQIHLNARQRRRNVRNAFRVAEREWVDGRRVLLVDDIMTTGATVNEVSRVLKQAGAVSVHVLTLARG
jgi:ComF family protein